MNTVITENLDAVALPLTESPKSANGHHEPVCLSPVAAAPPDDQERPTPASVFLPPQEEDWQRRSREVAAARRAVAAARLAERQRLARNEARLGAWNRE